MSLSDTSKYIIYSSLSDDLSDDELISKVKSFELKVWDHKTHLRLAYAVIKSEGRRAGVSIIMEMIESFINKSKNNIISGKTFHLTMTYFWIHMIHLAMVLNDYSFDDLLKKSPWLMNGVLFKHFYSDELMLKDSNSRKMFCPPDKRPLPNVIPK